MGLVIGLEHKGWACKMCKSMQQTMPRLITISYREFFLRLQIVVDSIVIISLFLFPFFQTLGSLVWSGHKYVLFGWQGRSPRSIHRALWQGTIHNWGLKIYVRTIYLNYFVIFVNSHYLVNNRLEVIKISQKITELFKFVPYNWKYSSSSLTRNHS